MPRERIEDLGRVLVLIDQCLDSDLFDMIQVRPKDFLEWFESLDSIDKNNFLESLPYEISKVSDILYQSLEILKGEDYLNESPHEN